MPKKYYKWVALAVLSGATLVGFDTGSFDPDVLQSFLSEAAQSEISKSGFFFIIAAWLHSGRMKKEIKLNFEHLTTAITSVADALRADMKIHRDRIDNLAKRVEDLEESTKLS